MRGRRVPYILRRLPGSWLGGDKRKLWGRLIALVEAKKDEDFRWRLYRKQVPLVDWAKESLGLCGSIRDGGELCRELEKRHPEGMGANLAEGFFQLVQRRGRDVFPYIIRHLNQVWRSWFARGSYGKMADYAREKGWWDLWSALIRTCSSSKEFNKQVLELVENRILPEKNVVERLLALAGSVARVELARLGDHDGASTGGIRGASTLHTFSGFAPRPLQAACAGEHLGAELPQVAEPLHRHRRRGDD